jgi:hypothetical protein
MQQNFKELDESQELPLIEKNERKPVVNIEESIENALKKPEKG